MHRSNPKCGPCTSDQITYENDDQAAASELATSLKEASGSPIYVPNFGQVQVTGVSQLDAPVVPAFTRSAFRALACMLLSFPASLLQLLHAMRRLHGELP